MTRFVLVSVVCAGLGFALGKFTHNPFRECLVLTPPGKFTFGVENNSEQTIRVTLSDAASGDVLVDIATVSAGSNLIIPWSK